MSKGKDSVYSALQKPVAQHGRNVFPLDNNHAFSMKAGQITPIKALHFKPKDYFDIKISDFSITFPMNTAPFLRGRKETALYSVYYNAVWSLFNQYQATRSDPKSSAFANVSTNMQNLAEPRIALFELYNAAYQMFIYYLYDRYLNAFDSGIGREGESWWDYPSTGNVFRRAWLNVDVTTLAPYTPASTFTDITSEVSSNIGGAFTAYNYTFKKNIYNPNSHNLTVEEWAFDVVGHHRAYNYVRKLDMLGYGNIYPLFRHCEDVVSAKMRAIDWTDSSSVSTNRSDIAKVIRFLLEDIINCTFSFNGTFANPTTPIVAKMVNLYPLCAYNSIFYHFFRNSYYDLSYYACDYNLDFVSINTSHGSINLLHLNDFTARLLDVEYHQWKKDKFTAVLPDQQFGAVSVISMNVVSSDDIGRWSFDLSGNRYAVALNDRIVTGNSATSADAGNTYGGASHTHEVVSQFDVLALKRAEMLQEYRQQLMRAGNKTSDIFRALYGESPSSEHSEDIIPRFLDTFGEDIFIDPVTATADTGQGQNGTLGDLSARGKFSGHSGSIKFNAGGNFGLIMALTYVVPTAEYNSYMLDKHLQELTPEDHYIAQFENVGLEDIYSDELNCLLPQNSLKTLGKAPRYHHKKTEVDQVHGAFVSFPAQPLLMQYGSGEESFYGEFNHWVSPRSDMQKRQSTFLRDLYINPSVLDNVFVQQAGADLSEDQFICYTSFDVKATKELSKVGMVNFV